MRGETGSSTTGHVLKTNLRACSNCRAGEAAFGDEVVVDPANAVFLLHRSV